MAIIRNSAKCATCGVEIVSQHRHDFNVHYCTAKPKTALEWRGDVLVEIPGEITWNFAVDGGQAYLKRCGEGFIDTSLEDAA